LDFFVSVLAFSSHQPNRRSPFSISHAELCCWSLLLGSTAASAHKVPSSRLSHGSSVPPHDSIFRFDCAASIYFCVLNFLYVKVGVIFEPLDQLLKFFSSRYSLMVIF
jgi:hypothetical protein